MNNKLINFRLDPAFLLDTIKNQSSGVAKAIVELIMNSVDAGSSKIDIELFTQRNGCNDKVSGFSITDDGKGFTKKDIMTFFRDFGSPHDNDAYYGAFRIGRGQVFAVAKTQWLSNSYEMLVDLENALKAKELNKLGFFLKKSDKKIKGCKISGEFYADLNDYEASDLRLLIRALKDLCLYCPIPIFVNGVKINRDIQSEPLRSGEILLEDDHAFYLLNPNTMETKLFNRGILVAKSSIDGLLLRGDVISKNPMRLTHARTEVLHPCKVFEEISEATPVINIQAFSMLDDTFKINDSFLIDFFLSIRARKLTDIPSSLLNSVLNAKFIKTLSNTNLSILQLAEYERLTFCYVNDDEILRLEKAEKIDNVKVVNESGLLRDIFRTIESYDFGCRTKVKMHLNGLKFLAMARWLVAKWCINKGKAVPVNKMKFLYIDSDSDKYASTYKTVDSEKKLDRNQKKLLKLATLANDILESTKYFKVKRSIALGSTDNPNTLAWTDGVASIHFNILKVDLVLPDKHMQLFNILIHEYCHDEQSTNTHYHGEEFYESFHDALMDVNIHNALETFLSAAKLLRF